MNAIGEIHTPMAWRSKEGFVALGAAAVAMTDRLALAIGLFFHDHARKKLTRRLPFHQPEPINSGATTSAGLQKKALGRAGKSLTMGWVAIEMI